MTDSGPILTDEMLDDRIAIVGTTGKGKTYAAKGFVERLLDANMRVAIVDPLGVWWGLRLGADRVSPGFPLTVFGGAHGDVDITDGMGAAVAKLVATRDFRCVIDLSGLSSNAARRRFMTAFAETVYELNTEPLHLILDEADLWVPQRPMPDQTVLLNRIDEIVRRGRVRGFIPWLISQRPAVIHKDVLSQATILIAMGLTSSQDRAAVGGWIEGQADKVTGKAILADLPTLEPGVGYVWAPARKILRLVSFPQIRTYDSSRTPKRGERVEGVELPPIDVSAIKWALASEGVLKEVGAKSSDGKALQAAIAKSALLEAQYSTMAAELADLHKVIEQVGLLLAPYLTQIFEGFVMPPDITVEQQREFSEAWDAAVNKAVKTEKVQPRLRAGQVISVSPKPNPLPAGDHITDLSNKGSAGNAADKLFTTLARHHPSKMTWGQVAQLTGLKARGGHFNAARKVLRDSGLITEQNERICLSDAGLAKKGGGPVSPLSPEQQIALWCEALPAPAPEMLQALYDCAVAERHEYTSFDDLAAYLSRKPSGGHWNSGISNLKANELVEVSGRKIRLAEFFQ
jgi:hypothetical protein